MVLHGDESESERFTGRLAAIGDTKRDKADTGHYSIMHPMDMAGAEEDLLGRAENSLF